MIPSTIDDLLQSLDSDEDVDDSIGDVDLERLLNGDEDEDIESIQVARFQLPQTQTNNPTNVDLSAYESQTAPSDFASNKRLSTASMSDTSPEKTIESTLNFESPQNDINIIAEYLKSESDDDIASKSTSKETKTTIDNFTTVDVPENASLLFAESREHRALQFSEKAQSALQMRRSSGSNNLVPANMAIIEELTVVSGQLQRNGSYQQHGPGAATTLAVCDKFIAIGTIRGMIIIFDHQQEIRRVLTAATTSKGAIGAVVSIDCLQDGSALLAGHRSGDILFWDCSKGTILKQLRDPSGDLMALYILRPITMSDATRVSYSLAESDSFHFITVSTESIITRFKISRSMLTVWTIESDCLLDESVGAVLASGTLNKYVSLVDNVNTNISGANSPVSSKSHGNYAEDNEVNFTASYMNSKYVDLRSHSTFMQFLAFSFAHQTCIVRVGLGSEAKILYKWIFDPRSAGVIDEGSTQALLEWAWLSLPLPSSHSESNGANGASAASLVPTPCLTRCHFGQLEILAIRALRGATGAVSKQPNSTNSTATPALPARRSSLMSFNPFAGASMSPSQASTASASASSAVAAGMIGSPAESETLQGFQFDVISSIPLSMLCKESKGAIPEVLSIRWTNSHQLLLVTAQGDILLLDTSLTLLERISLPSSEEALVHTYSLASSSSMYALTALNLQRIRTRSPLEAVAGLIASGRWLEGLARVVDAGARSPVLLIREQRRIGHFISSYAQLAVKQRGGEKNDGSHYSLAASVCVEYCLLTAQLPLLYGSILDIFRSEGHASALLFALEPFILSGALSSLPPAVTAELLESCLSANRAQAVARAVSCLDPHLLDLNFVLRFLFANSQLVAFLTCYSQGLGDFDTAFRLGFQMLLDAEDDARRSEFGQVLMLFAWYCVEGKKFPRGTVLAEPSTTAASMLPLLASEKHESPEPIFGKRKPKASNRESLYDKASYPYLRFFAAQDSRALLFVLERGVIGICSHFLAKESIGETELAAASAAASAPLIPKAAESVIAQVLFSIYKFASSQAIGDEPNVLFLFFEKFEKYISSISVAVPIDLLESIVKHVAGRGFACHEANEEMLSALAEHQARFAHASQFHSILVENGFYIAALVLRKSASVTVSVDFAEHQKAMQAYSELSIKLSPLSKGRLLCFRWAEAQIDLCEALALFDQKEALIGLLLRFLSKLCAIDVALSARLVVVYFISRLGDAISSVGENSHLQYALVSNILEKVKQQGEAAQSLPPGPLIQIAKLIASQEPDALRIYLSDFSSQLPLDEMLLIAKSASIADAVALLQEKAGDISGALTTLLSDVSSRIRQARRDIDGQLRSEARDIGQVRRAGHISLTTILSRNNSNSGGSSQYPAAELSVRVHSLRALSLAIDETASLCERNAISKSTGNEHPGSGMQQDPWYRAFDHLLDENHSLKAGTISTSSEAVAHFLSHALQGFMAKMKMFVSPKDIITRVLNHASIVGIRLGEFKDVMLNMLALNRHELLLAETVRSVCKKDLQMLHAKRLSKMRSYVMRNDDALLASLPSSVLSMSDSTAGGPADSIIPPSDSSNNSKSSNGNSANRRWSSSTGGASSRWKIAKLRDVKSMVNRAQDQIYTFQPTTTVPADFGNADSFDERRPGYFDDSKCKRVTIDEALLWD